MSITATGSGSSLLSLPWNLPLEEWPEEICASLPRGISRHVVRFIFLDGHVVAVKEIGEHRAHHEYQMLRALRVLGAPAVEPLAVVDDRQAEDGTPLAAALVTRHLSFSLPYRALFDAHQSRDTVNRLIDALSVLLVRLHLMGFFWGDVSLSNTLFRRDAGEFAASLVDAETGELNTNITDGKREYDIDVARVNIIGELMDLQAAGTLDPEFDCIAVGDRLVTRYTELWEALTSELTFTVDQQWRVNDYIQKLNALGFDVEELEITTDDDGQRVHVQPKVVDLGHFSRKIYALTGMDVHENQARRLMNDIGHFRAATGQQNADLGDVAHEWMETAFLPTVRAVPRDLRGKLEPAELYHQFLDHRWFISQRAGRDISWAPAITSFINYVLQHHRDEASYIEIPERDDE